MSEISRKALFGKLGTSAYRSVEAATLYCKSRGNPYVELSHWIHQMLAQDDCDFVRLLGGSDVHRGRLIEDLARSIDRLPRGATSISDLSVHVEASVERGWVYASLLFGAERVRTGHLLLGWLKTPTLRNGLSAISPELLKLNVDDLVRRFDELTAGSSEASRADDGAGSPSGPAPNAGVDRARGSALQRYSVDLVERARDDRTDPIVGRDEEIRQLIQVLMRRRQNNPILTGEAGVGKTAVVEGFAQRIARGEVPPALADVDLRALDVALLQAGASMKGEFEARLRQVIDEVQASVRPVILFVDETHTLVGAGGPSGTGDAANLLKPALARGELRTIGATTWAEYKKHIESDPALVRRFQVVQVQEPDADGAVAMLRASASRIERHHRVQLLDDALEAAVHLSRRFIPDRQLPDKAVSLLDTACARVAVSQHAVPAEVEDARSSLRALETEREIAGRERLLSYKGGERCDALDATVDAARDRVAHAEQRWQRERALVEKILGVRARLRAASTGDGDTPGLLREQETLATELALLQGERPMVLPTVDAQAIASVVSDWTGIPTGKMARSEIESVLGLREHLETRVIGQRQALEMFERRVLTARAGLENPDKPVGVFLLAGPSGVGKTETALALGEALYGGQDNVITINMSEFQEAHSVATLKGAPPGYVGFGQGGVLTEAVRRRPHSVVLLDEIEKAHPDVHEIFFQVFDKGWMEDGQGVRVDFRNTIIILTSNVGSDAVLRACESDRPSPEQLDAALRPELARAFPAALLGRMIVVPYYPLSDEVLESIVALQLGRVSRRVRDRYGVPLDYDQSVVDLVRRRCTEVESGGRTIDAFLTNSLLPDVSRELLLRTLAGREVDQVRVRARAGALEYRFDSTEAVEAAAVAG